MRVAICDDVAQEQDRFVEALHGWNPAQDAERYADGASLLEAAKAAPPFDLVFMDVYLPGESGVDAARALHALSPRTGVAFLTTSREHAVEAFSLHALHYLVKPVTVEGVAETFQRLAELRAQPRSQIALTVGSTRHTVFQDQICYLENDNHAVNVSLSDGRRLKVWMSIGELERKLDDRFLKINRGLIVNMDAIAQMGADDCVLRDGSRLPVAVRQRTAIRAAYDEYLFGRLSRRPVYGEAGL